MKLGGLFGSIGTKQPLMKSTKATPAPVPRNVATHVEKILKPGEFAIEWGRPAAQQVKDYSAVLDLSELEEYFKKCQETGYASFDWETGPSEETRAYYEPLLQQLEDRINELEEELLKLVAVTADKANIENHKGVVASLTAELKVKQADYKEHKEAYLKTPLDPHQGAICTVSISAAPNESRVVPISHLVGKNIAPEMTREAAREAVLDLMDKYLFNHKDTLKIAVNLAFETKYAAKYGRYILGKVADPLILWVRCMQLGAPGKIKNPKHPATGWGLKPTTKAYMGVNMQDFSLLLEKKGVNFFDEIDASSTEGLVYSAEDSDYGLQHYIYWAKIAEQLPGYYDWLHNYEMPFMRVIGLMEYWGMPWNKETADAKRIEAVAMQAAASDHIKKVIRDATGVEVDPKKTGKSKGVKDVMFSVMKLPIPKTSDKTGLPSLDEEALIDMKFMLENNLVELDEEKYLSVPLPAGWESIDPDAAYGTEGFNGGISKDERGAIRLAKREAHPYKEAGLSLIGTLLKIQSYSTLLSSHIDGRQKFLNPVTARIHSGYSTFTETGRLNSFKPNAQNVPRMDNDDFGIRTYYAPKPGKVLFFIDFSGFELRIISWKSGDEVMIELFNTGGDMHKRTASTLTGKPESEITKTERTNAKAGNFGIAYSGTEYALQTTFKTQYGIRKTLDEAAAIVQAVKETYPRIPEMQRNEVLKAREKGYSETIYGYKRLLPNINGPSKRERSADERRSGNTPVQGSAADIMKDCQNKVYDRIGEDTFAARQLEKGKEQAERVKEQQKGIAEAMAPIQIPLFIHGKVDMIAQIHDEMIFEMDDDPQLVKEAGEWIKALMERPPLEDFPVPIEAEASVGYTWGSKISVEEYLQSKGM